MSESETAWTPIEIKPPEDTRTVVLKVDGVIMFWDDGQDGWPVNAAYYFSLPAFPWSTE